MTAKDYRYIFNLSSGYSGTAYAAALLSKSDGILAEHEATPNLFGPWTALYNDTEDTADPELIEPLEDKFESIREKLAKHQLYCYADTSHGFIKGWGPLAVEYSIISPENTKLISTKRDPASIVRSMTAQRMIPGGAIFPCDHYWLDPHAKNNRLHLSAGVLQEVLNEMLPYGDDGFILPQLIHCSWYVLEIEQRIKEFKSTNAFDIFELSIDRLNPELIRDFYEFCELEVPENIFQEHVNKKEPWYKVDQQLAEIAYYELRKRLIKDDRI